MRIGVFFTFFVLIYVNSFSQIPEIIWQHCYGTSGTDMNYAIANSTDGYLLGIEVNTGEGVSNYHGLSDIWIVNINSRGEIIWEKCYGGSNYDTPNKILKLDNNQYYIYGATKSENGDVQSTHYGGADLWVLKINGEGDLLWEKCYGGPGIDEFRDMILTPDGGFLLLCRTSSAGGDISLYYGLNDVWIAKCDSLGNIEWEKTLGNQWLDNAGSMILNSEGNIIMIGAAAHYGGIVDCGVADGYGDVWLVEMSLSSGDIVWQQCYGGSYYELGYDIIEIENGYLFISGSQSNDGDVSGHHGPAGNPPDGWSDIWIIHINYSGEIVWQNSFGGTGGEYPRYLTNTEDGGIIIIGTTNSNDGDVSGNHSEPGGYDTDIWVFKLNAEGIIEWQQCYGGWGSEYLQSIHTILKKDDDNYLIMSSTDYKSGDDDIQCDIHANYDRDIWLFEIKDTTVGVQETPVITQLKAYPNPAGNYVIFEINNPAIQNGAERSEESNLITITNTFGQQITQLEIKNAKTVWDTRKIQEGVYFYFVEIKGKRYSGKVVVQR